MNDEHKHFVWLVGLSVAAVTLISIAGAIADAVKGQPPAACECGKK